MTRGLLAVAGGGATPLPSRWFNLSSATNVGWTGTDGNGNSVYYNGNTYVAYIDSSGHAKVAAYNHSTGTTTTSPTIVSGSLTADIHCTPSILVRQSDHKLVLAVAPHNTANMYIAISTNAEDVSAWGAATDIGFTLSGSTYTYANLFQLSGESGKMYLFYRDEQSAGATAALCYSTSTNGGSTWSSQTTLYKNTGTQTYWAIASDSTSRIDFTITDGTAAAGNSTASLYHFYYDGSFRKSDGTAITPTLGPANLTLVYDGTNGGMRVPYSLRYGPNPAVGFATYDPAGSGQPELYWYAKYSGGTWTPHQIASSGSVPDSNFSEGGVALDRTATGVVYVSRKVSGVWTLMLYTTADNGATWSTLTLAPDGDSTHLNLRPMTPRNAAADLRCVWLYGSHVVSGGLELSSAQVRAHPTP